MATRKDTAPKAQSARSHHPAPAEAPSRSSLARIMELQALARPTQAEQAELYRLETEWHNRWCADHPAQSAPLPAYSEEEPAFTPGSAIAEAVEDQRTKLYRLEGVLRCVAHALDAETPSEKMAAAAGALELAAEEVARVNLALDQVSLLRTVQEQRKAVEDAREVLASGEAQS